MFSIGAGILALLIAAMLSSSIMRAEAGNALMQEISGHIHEGAMAFLYREYKRWLYSSWLLQLSSVFSWRP